MPWRRLISAAAGEVMKASSAAAASARGERGGDGADEGRDDRQRRRQGPQQLDAGFVAQLAQLLKAELGRPLASRAATGVPGGAWTRRSRKRSARPQRSKSFSKAVPLGPVE